MPLIDIIIIRTICVLIIKLFLLFNLDEYINFQSFSTFLQKIMLALMMLWVVIYSLCPKGVFLYKDKLIIKRYNITLRNWKFLIPINYSDIDRVSMNYTDLRKTKYYGCLLVPFGDEAYNVEITLKNGKKYAESFCNELVQRINS